MTQPTNQTRTKAPISQQTSTGGATPTMHQHEQPSQIPSQQPMSGGSQPPAARSPMGGQGSMQHQQPMGGQDLLLEEGLSPDMQTALREFAEAVKVCEWCADSCIDEGPQMAECIRLCRDVADIASLNAQLLSRNSVFEPQAAELFVTVAEACIRECAQHSHRHCQACADVLDRAVVATQKMLADGGATGSGMQM